MTDRNSKDVVKISTEMAKGNLTALEADDMPVIEEEDKDDMDELMSQREIRHSEVSRNVESGNLGSTQEIKHPTRRLTIVGREVRRPVRLLYRREMKKDEFQQVIDIILMRICECLHRDINKSCFVLRMIFYRNFCAILEQLVPFLNQSNILELFKYLVRPLRALTRNNLGITQSLDDNNILNESQRMTMTQQREQSSRHIGANNMGSALVSEAKMV